MFIGSLYHLVIQLNVIYGLRGSNINVGTFPGNFNENVYRLSVEISLITYRLDCIKFLFEWTIKRTFSLDYWKWDFPIPGLSDRRSFVRSDGQLVVRLVVQLIVCHNFLKGRKVSLPCAYQSTCFMYKSVYINHSPRKTPY